MDPRTPVLVGGGQWTVRDDERDETRSPVQMLAEAVRRAAASAGAPALLGAIDSVRVVGLLSWRYRDPGALVAAALGTSVRHTVYTGNGGSHPQALVNDACEDVAAGRCDVVVVGGAEAWRTRTALRAEGRRPAWEQEPDDAAPTETRPDVPMRHETEVRVGLDRPVHVYPLVEQAVRAAAGRGVEEHGRRVADLWARFAAVAATNPHAWVRDAPDAATIGTPGPRNRMVAAPYPKLLSSNNAVEQAAAVVVCSVAAARRLGVPEDRWVFPLAGAEASDTAAIAARPVLAGSPAIRLAGAAALDLAGVALADLGPVDLYSCFPSAVQVAAAELGLPVDDPGRELTVTGGLTFAGGPWNNYTTHALATMHERVLAEQRPGLVTANSGYLTKHSIGVYGAAPPRDGFRRASARATQAAVDAVGTTPVVATWDGPAELEAWTVVHDRDLRPERVLAALRVDGRDGPRDPDGPDRRGRTLAASDDAALAAHLVTAAAEGSRARVRADGSFTLV
nr:hypothetical protein [Nocardioides zeae]